MSDVSFHIQSLAVPELFPEIQNAVDNKDKNSLIQVCKKAKIPAMYIGVAVSTLLAVGPEQKWPPLI
jgi:hypothetical protein